MEYKIIINKYKIINSYKIIHLVINFTTNNNTNKINNNNNLNKIKIFKIFLKNQMKRA